jgi:excisionase family DNA binding protein
MPAKSRAAPRWLEARRWLTVQEAARYSGYSVRTIRKRIANGDLPAFRPRGSRVLRIDADDVDAMITAKGRVASAHLGDGRPAAPRAGKGDHDAA